MPVVSLLLVLFSGLSMAQPAAPPARSPVYFALDNQVVGPTGVIQARTVRRMVDSVICRLAGQPTPGEAWRKLVAPTDVVGIKVAASGRSVSGTRPETVLAIAEGLREAGVPAKNIIVWDRNLEDLVAAGFDQSGRDYQLEGVDSRTGYDSEAQVSAPIIGKLIWGDSQFGKRDGTRLTDTLGGGDQLSNRSYYAKVLSKKVTKVINVPSLTDSFGTGVNGGIANMTLANLDNWRRFSKASAEGDSYLAEVYADPMIHEKVVVTILDALILQYAGGPFPNPNFTMPNYAIFASRDVVAIDSTAIRLIDERRVASKLPSVRDMAQWLDAAVQLGLGQSSEARIEMIRVGVEDFR